LQPPSPVRRIAPKGGEYSFDDRVGAPVATVDAEMGGAIGIVASLGHSLEGGRGVIAIEKRSMSRSGKPFGNLVDGSVEPDRYTVFKQASPKPRIHKQAAARCEDDRPGKVEPVDERRFQLSEMRLALIFEHRSDRRPGRAFDLFIRVDEAKTQAAGEKAPDRRLASAHEADKGDRPGGRKSLFGHEAGAIQIARCWGKRPAMPRPRYDFGPQRRRRSPLKTLLILLLVLFVGLVIYASTVDTEVPVGPIEQDVTNEVLAQ
jgi:hypothetical protein